MRVEEILKINKRGGWEKNPKTKGESSHLLER